MAERRVSKAEKRSAVIGSTQRCRVMPMASSNHLVTDLVRLDCFREATTDLLYLIGSLGRQPRIAINDVTLSGFSPVHRDDTLRALGSLTTVKSLDFRGMILASPSRSEGITTLGDMKPSWRHART